MALGHTVTLAATADALTPRGLATATGSTRTVGTAAQSHQRLLAAYPRRI